MQVVLLYSWGRTFCKIKVEIVHRKAFLKSLPPSSAVVSHFIQSKMFAIIIAIVMFNARYLGNKEIVIIMCEVRICILAFG